VHQARRGATAADARYIRELSINEAADVSGGMPLMLAAIAAGAAFLMSSDSAAESHTEQSERDSRNGGAGGASSHGDHGGAEGSSGGNMG
jgi:hypothetical protein